MATKSSKNEMLVFALCSTSDDWLSDLSNESCPKCTKMAAQLYMLIFGLHLTSDDQLSDPSNESHLKWKKGHQIIKK